jgi:shikimate dehydrogenase
VNSVVRKAGVMGWPIAHSRSPLIHNHWFAQHSIDANYERMPVPVEGLAEAVRGLLAAGYVGCNLTLPHKVAVLPLLSELSPAAAAIGAANVVMVKPNGDLIGHNTDAFGYLHNLRQAAPRWQPAHGPALILGAGGAARAVAYALAQARVPELGIVNRSVEKAQELAASMIRAFPGLTATAYAWEQREDAALLRDCALLVNTTELGMQGKLPLELSLNALPAHAVVSDIVYAPLVTPLLHAAAARGLVTSDGLGMLLYQTQAAFELWFGLRPEVTAELRALLEADLSR